jgi:iron complex transport system substrate-binding protein
LLPRTALAGLVLALVGGCMPAASPPPTIPADATMSAGPPMTGTPRTAASSAPSASSAAFPLSLVDDEGASVELPAEPMRIVSLTPANTEILFALGVGERVVATTDFDDYPPEALPLPDVASFTAVDVEQIVDLEADLVVAGGNNFNDPAAIARLRGLDVPVLVVYPPTVDAVFADIELIGRAVGRADGAERLTQAMEADFEAVAGATADAPRPRVFYEIDAQREIYTAADDSFIAEMIELAGGEPITSGSTTSFEISLERLIEANPEVILLGDTASGVTAEAVKARAGWNVMTAVRNDAIRPVDDVVITRPGPRLTDGLRALATAIHPDVALPSPAASPSPSRAP